MTAIGEPAPVTVTGDAGTPAVGVTTDVHVAAYCVIANPPVLPGAVNATVTSPVPAVALTRFGAPGAVPTTRVAVAPALSSASGVVTAPVGSANVPVEGDVTATEYVQVTPAGIVAPVTRSAVAPAVAAAVAVQPAPPIASAGLDAFTSGAR